jgi:hypothetical protein
MAGAGGSSKEDLAVMMNRLGLQEEDLNNVVFEDEAPSPTETTGKLAIARFTLTSNETVFVILNFILVVQGNLQGILVPKEKKKHSSKVAKNIGKSWYVKEKFGRSAKVLKENKIWERLLK